MTIPCVVSVMRWGEMYVDDYDVKVGDEGGVCIEML